MILNFKLAFLIFFPAINSCLLAQEVKEVKLLNFNTGITASYVHQGIEFLSIGGIIGQNYGLKKSQLAGTGLCLDLSVNQNTTTLAPRLFFEGGTDFIGFRVNLVNYMRNSDNDVRICPEINLTYLGLINISAGYSFKLLNKRFKDIENFRFSIAYNFLFMRK